MGIDIFLTVADILIAAALTWFIIWYFLLRQHETESNDQAHGFLDTQGSGKVTQDSMTHNERIHRLRMKSQQTKKLTLISAVLTAPVLLIDLCTLLDPAVLPAWLTSPWIQAIVITPVVFYCGRPIYADGWQQLRHSQTNLSSLVTIATALAYTYSLTACAFTNLLPAGSQQPYFDVIGTITTLALFASLSEQNARLRALTGKLFLNKTTNHIFTNPPDTSHQISSQFEKIIYRALSSKSDSQSQANKLLSRAEPIVMIIAVWTFMIWLLVGLQPHLAHAVANAVSVLIIACPTAIAVSIPLSFTTALSSGLNHGILYTSYQAMNQLAATQTVVIDESAIGTTIQSDTGQPSFAELARTSTHLRGIGVTSVVLEKENSDTSQQGDYIEKAAREAGVDFLFTGVDHKRKAHWTQRFSNDLHRMVEMEPTTNSNNSKSAGFIAFAAAAGAEPQAQSAAQTHIVLSPDLSPLAGDTQAHQEDNIDLLLQTGNLDGIAQAIELAQASKKVSHLNLVWAYTYNLLAVLLATGITYPVWEWMLNPMVAPVATLIAALIPIGNLLLLGKHTRLSKRWHFLAQAKPEELPTLAARRPQIIADADRTYNLSSENAEWHPADHPVPDQTRQ